MHVVQPANALGAVEAAVAPITAFELTALHTMTTLTGSALLALGVIRGAWDVERAWAAANVDEDWQIAEWGEDGEATARRRQRAVEMTSAGRLIQLVRQA